MLGKNPRNILPGAYVQFLRIDGVELSDPIVDEELIEGDLNKVVQRIDDKLIAHNRVQVDFTSGPVEKRTYQYPLGALQQLARNAVMHRTYENTNAPVRLYWFTNRIEILSPGGAFGAVNSDNFGEPGLADYRNPHLADAMKVLGFVQRFGVGIQTAQRELTENGNPPVQFNVDQNWVRCVVKAVPGFKVEPVNEPVNEPAKMILNNTQKQIFSLIKANKAITYDELADSLKKGRSTIMRNIRLLKDAGILHRIGSDKSGHWEIFNPK